MGKTQNNDQLTRGQEKTFNILTLKFCFSAILMPFSPIVLWPFHHDSPPPPQN